MSLTVVWLPLAAAMIIVHFFRILMRHRINHSSISFIKILSLALIIILISFVLNYKERILSFDYHLYSYVLPFIIILSSLLTLATNFKDNELLYLQKVLLGIFFINIVISLSQFFLLLFNFITVDFFYRNIRYTVIGFLMDGRLLIRIPGIFESGATNAFFTASICFSILSHFAFRIKKKKIFKTNVFFRYFCTYFYFKQKVYSFFFNYNIYILYFIEFQSNKKILHLSNYWRSSYRIVTLYIICIL